MTLRLAFLGLLLAAALGPLLAPADADGVTGVCSELGRPMAKTHEFALYDGGEFDIACNHRTRRRTDVSQDASTLPTAWQDVTWPSR